MKKKVRDKAFFIGIPRQGETYKFGDPDKKSGWMNDVVTSQTKFEKKLIIK